MNRSTPQILAESTSWMLMVAAAEIVGMHQVQTGANDLQQVLVKKEQGQPYRKGPLVILPPLLKAGKKQP